MEHTHTDTSSRAHARVRGTRLLVVVLLFAHSVLAWLGSQRRAPVGEPLPCRQQPSVSHSAEALTHGSPPTPTPLFHFCRAVRCSSASFLSRRVRVQYIYIYIKKANPVCGVLRLTGLFDLLSRSGEGGFAPRGVACSIVAAYLALGSE